MYYNHNWQLAEEFINACPPWRDDWDDEAADDDHTRRMQYIWGPRYIDDIVARQQRDPMGTLEPGAQVKTWYHITDTLFSTVAIIDDDAQLIERVSYDAYGNARHHRAADLVGNGLTGTGDQIALLAAWGDYGVGDLDRNGIVNTGDLLAMNNNWGAALAEGQISATGGTDNIVGYAGYVFNAEVHTSGGGGGLYTVRHRHYVPELGRWLTRDPIGYVDGMGLYEYVYSDPVNYVDTYGLQAAPLPIPHPTTPNQFPGSPLKHPGEGPLKFPAPKAPQPPKTPLWRSVPRIAPRIAPILIIPGGLEWYIRDLERRNWEREIENLQPLTPREIERLPRPKPSERKKRRDREICDAMKDACLLTSLADCDPIGGGRCYWCWTRCTNNANRGVFPPWPDELSPGATCKYWEFPSVDG